MNSNQCRGTSLTATSSAAGASELPRGLDDGLRTRGISSVMADERLDSTDDLQHFGLGPC